MAARGHDPISREMFVLRSVPLYSSGRRAEGGTTRGVGQKRSGADGKFAAVFTLIHIEVPRVKPFSRDLLQLRRDPRREALMKGRLF